MGLAIQSAYQRTVADDHRQRRFEFARDRQREVVAPACDQRDLDAAACRLGYGRAVRFRQFPPAIEQRAVDIQGDQAYSHSLYCSVKPCLFRWFDRQGVLKE